MACLMHVNDYIQDCFYCFWKAECNLFFVYFQTVEKRPREMMLRREFAHAVGYLNQILPEDNQLKFIHWDFHKFAKTYVFYFRA